MTDIFKDCADLNNLRTWAYNHQSIASTDSGKFWLPLVCTARGTLYAEVIYYADGKYKQPFHLQDQTRQPLYKLGYGLLCLLKAPPAVYLLKFDILSPTEILFDRLIASPTEPAIASVGVQEPNLYECHLLCTTNQPIYDLVIAAV